MGSSRDKRVGEASVAAPAPALGIAQPIQLSGAMGDRVELLGRQLVNPCLHAPYISRPRAGFIPAEWR